jgi:3-demethoxyubiquinol 3-hydroxylase
MTDLMDTLTVAIDNALRTLCAKPSSGRSWPVPSQQQPLLEQERTLSGSLMRVNHVGEVCAQAMYSAQAIVVRDPALRAYFTAAAKEETEHLAWTAQRLTELGARRSALNPLWYTGAFVVGLIVGRISDKTSLGFVVETERQVEQHLKEHLDRLPSGDLTSRAIVEQMRHDEAKHAAQALEAGSDPLPPLACSAMRVGAKFMTVLAHHL